MLSIIEETIEDVQRFQKEKQAHKSNVLMMKIAFAALSIGAIIVFFATPEIPVGKGITANEAFIFKAMFPTVMFASPLMFLFVEKLQELAFSKRIKDAKNRAATQVAGSIRIMHKIEISQESLLPVIEMALLSPYNLSVGVKDIAGGIHQIDFQKGNGLGFDLASNHSSQTQQAEPADMKQLLQLMKEEEPQNIIKEIQFCFEIISKLNLTSDAAFIIQRVNEDIREVLKMQKQLASLKVTSGKPYDNIQQTLEALRGELQGVVDSEIADVSTRIQVQTNYVHSRQTVDSKLNLVSQE